MRNLRLQALQELDRRLWQLALSELAELDPQLRQQCLDALAAEIPPDEWQQVTVHHDDVPAVKKIFPADRIKTDAAIGGGLMVSSDNGDIRVDNSLRKRLEKSWPELSGRMLAELEEGMEGDSID